MSFQSILYKTNDNHLSLSTLDIPECFEDLNLNQVIDTITSQKNEYNLKPFFYSPLNDLDTINYRQEVFRDLESDSLLKSIKSFAEKMAIVRRYLDMIHKLNYRNHQQGWFLEAAIVYCDAIKTISSNLSQAQIQSQGLLGLRDYLNSYVQTSHFSDLLSKTTEVKTNLGSIQYCVIIKENRVKVRRYEAEIDYSIEVEKTFEKFKQGEVKNYRTDLIVSSGMNHVEAQIVDCVTKLFPQPFKELEQYCEIYDKFLDETIRVFDREIQFYISYIDFIANIKEMKLDFCYPQASDQKKKINCSKTFDIALANSMLFRKDPIICNDFFLKNPERIFIISGPNQGGKTTFARMFGQIHYLASLGLPVPGRNAQLFLFDNIFTHFEKEEDIRNLRGKLQDDLIRVHEVLGKATSKSIIILNEIFTSTSLSDAVYLSKQILEKIIELDSYCICVSFIDELSTMSIKTVSMISTIVPDNPAVRTYKIVRKPADGLSYAKSIADKYQLSYDSIKERIIQ
ncbi:MAG: DNA mismatch repair protein MutS [Bacteroidetes bacterium]|nr:DNA mismatch repair protein MutS [Bacteroidota bacterium]